MSGGAGSQVSIRYFWEFSQDRTVGTAGEVDSMNEAASVEERNGRTRRQDELATMAVDDDVEMGKKVHP